MATGISKTKWNGDYRQHNCSQGSSEIFLSYKGKRSEEEILSMKPSINHSKLAWKHNQGIDSENQLYFGDNLNVLLNFLNDSSIEGKINLIYIDPPFATKNVFQSRSQNDAYCDLLAGHSYIEFLRERLVVLREILAENGSIYVHLDNNMAFYVKVIMDEIFGIKNFRSWITRKKCNPKNYTKKTFGNVSDYILFYTKSDNYIWNRPFEEWTSERALKEYQYIEEKTGRRYKKVPVHAPGVRNGETGQPWRGMLPPPGKHWQYPPSKLEEMDARGEMYWSSNGNPRRKVYLDDSIGIPMQDIWLDYRDAHNQNIKITGYPTEKNPDLIERIIKASSNPNDIVLDCFSGSGTTLSVAADLNRRWIGIDNSPEAIITTIERFTKGTERMGDFVNNNQKKRESGQLSFEFNETLIESEKEIVLRNCKKCDFFVFTEDTRCNELKDLASIFL
jgi:adenine-specific DNA-methyltransferase